MIRFLLLAVFATLLTLVVAIPRYLGPDDISRCPQPTSSGDCRVVDAIVAVSGGDTNARTDEAVAMYKAGWAPSIIFSGAAADTDGPSNAEAMARRAVADGVPESAIAVEEFSRTTAENALNTSQFIAERELDRIMLVTSAYHQRRALLEFSTSAGPSVTVINHPVATDEQWVGNLWWTTKNGWWLAVGELLKIIAFYAEQGAESRV